MANEVTVNSGLQIQTTSLNYISQPQSFTGNMTGRIGPTPGSIAVTQYGTNVDLSQLTVPGFCRIMNYDATYFVEVGIWDPENLRFYPLMEVGPLETYVFKLARNLHEEYGTGGVGTGTVGAAVNQLRLRAVGGNCVVTVEAFER
jgi:hypothetical protein